MELGPGLQGRWERVLYQIVAGDNWTVVKQQPQIKLQLCTSLLMQEFNCPLRCFNQCELLCMIINAARQHDHSTDTDQGTGSKPAANHYHRHKCFFTLEQIFKQISQMGSMERNMFHHGGCRAFLPPALWFTAAAVFIYLSENRCLMWLQSSGQHWVQGPAFFSLLKAVWSCSNCCKEVLR